MTRKKKHHAKPATKQSESKEATVSPVETAHEVVPAPLSETEALKAELDKIRDEASDCEERFLRARAEVENIRRRSETEVANTRKFAIEGFASEVLAVKDSLELARSVDIEQDNKQAVEKMFEGLDLTLKQLESVFEKFSLQEINPAAGDKFDPGRHQAMSAMESDEVAPNHIAGVMQKGYALHDRLLRPAMVIVAKAGTEQSNSEE